MNYLLQNQDLSCEFSPNVTPRDGNCLLHAVLDGILYNEAFKHTGPGNGTEVWTSLLKRIGIYSNSMTDKEYIQFLRNRWVVGASEWLAGENGSKENDKLTYGYSDHEWNFIWNSMVEDGAWAVSSIKDKAGNIVKENHAPEFFIKFIAHDLQCNIIVFDLFNKTVEFCSGNQLLDSNVKFESPLLLYTTGSHFQSLVPTDHEYFINYAKELECKYVMGSLSTRNIVTVKLQKNGSREATSENTRIRVNSETKQNIPSKRARLEDMKDIDDATVSQSTEGEEENLRTNEKEKADSQKGELRSKQSKSICNDKKKDERKRKENELKKTEMWRELTDDINRAKERVQEIMEIKAKNRSVPEKKELARLKMKISRSNKNENQQAIQREKNRERMGKSRGDDVFRQKENKKNKERIGKLREDEE